MSSEPSSELHRSCLPPGTVVEGWRLLGCHGHGAHGVVYRAERVGHEDAGPVAFKLARWPWDPRFMRELALLTLVRHPSAPRLLGHGFLRHPSGVAFPFIIMEWIEGTPLYEWAREQAPTSREVRRVLAHLARTLQATHACRAVHRDVKGDNVLVRRSDGRAMLVDFGSGCYEAAPRVTWQSLPPGTPAYQSPELGLFQIRAVRSLDAHYQAKPADDVYALGITAYRLVTGEYPPGPGVQEDEEGTWHLKEVTPPEPRKFNPQVEPELSALILRMLSLSPEARGTAREVAEALEAGLDSAELERGAASEPSAVPEAQQSASRIEAAPPQLEMPTAVAASTARAGVRARLPMGIPPLMLALAAVLLAFYAGRVMHVGTEGAPTVGARSPPAGEPRASPIDLGEQAPAEPLTPKQAPAERKAIGEGQPPKPIPGQVTPDAKGRCPGSKQIPLNGGCWAEFPAADARECEQNGYEYFKDRCYAPALDKRRKGQPTSEPPP
jgi:eukaryotic-like serine/threonine-protein kinase